jgi:hypothetical protein
MSFGRDQNPVDAGRRGGEARAAKPDPAWWWEKNPEKALEASRKGVEVRQMKRMLRLAPKAPPREIWRIALAARGSLCPR